MANNLKKLAIFSTLAGVAAAGTYYLLQKNNETSKKEAEDIDDFDDFDENLDDDDDDFSPKAKRAYVSLDLNSAKEIVSENVIKAIDKTKEFVTDFNIPEKLDKAKEFVEEFSNSTPVKETKAETPVYTDIHVSEDEPVVKTEEKENADVDKDIEEDFDADSDDDSEDFEFSDDK